MKISCAAMLVIVILGSFTETANADQSVWVVVEIRRVQVELTRPNNKPWDTRSEKEPGCGPIAAIARTLGHPIAVSFGSRRQLDGLSTCVRGAKVSSQCASIMGLIVASPSIDDRSSHRRIIATSLHCIGRHASRAAARSAPLLNNRSADNHAQRVFYTYARHQYENHRNYVVHHRRTPYPYDIGCPSRFRGI